MDKGRTDEIIAESARTIFSYCRARTSSKVEAEDLSQDIMLELLGAKGSFVNDKAFYGFMWAVAGNVYKNWCKKRAKAVLLELDERIPDRAAPIDEVIEKEEVLRLLYRELSLLNEQHRKATILYYFDDLKVSQISKSLNISESMVKFLLFKSRKILKEGMSMERTTGNLSFNPGHMTLALWGKSWPGYVDPTAFERNLIAQNILLACYHESCTAEELSLQMGVAVPYLENDLNELCACGLLTRKGGRYETAIVIFTREFSIEADMKTMELQREMAELIGRALDEQLAEIKAVGFHQGGVDDGLLKWRITQLILEQAVLRKNEESRNISTKHAGHEVIILGAEDYISRYGRYGCLTVENSNAHGDVIRFLEFFANSFREKIFDFGYFWQQENRINLLFDIAKGKTDGFSEGDKLEIAEFIKNGWAKKDGSGLSLCIPVYTAEQYERVEAILAPVTDKVAEITRKILEISTGILLQHTPASLKKEARNMSWLKKHDIAMSGPVEIMRSSGALRHAADNEHPSVYVVLK